MKVLKNFQSRDCFDYKFLDGTMRFTENKIMIKPKWGWRFKTIMDKKNGKWGTSFKKKDIVNGVLPFYFYSIEGLRLKGVTLIMCEIESKGLHVVSCSRIFKHRTIGKELHTMIYYNTQNTQNEVR